MEEEVFACETCGKDVPGDADKCPHCGALFVEDDHVRSWLKDVELNDISKSLITYLYNILVYRSNELSHYIKTRKVFPNFIEDFINATKECNDMVALKKVLTNEFLTTMYEDYFEDMHDDLLKKHTFKNIYYTTDANNINLAKITITRNALSEAEELLMYSLFFSLTYKLDYYPKLKFNSFTESFNAISILFSVAIDICVIIIYNKMYFKNKEASIFKVINKISKNDNIDDKFDEFLFLYQNEFQKSYNLVLDTTSSQGGNAFVKFFFFLFYQNITVQFIDEKVNDNNIYSEDEILTLLYKIVDNKEGIFNEYLEKFVDWDESEYDDEDTLNYYTHLLMAKMIFYYIDYVEYTTFYKLLSKQEDILYRLYKSIKNYKTNKKINKYLSDEEEEIDKFDLSNIHDGDGFELFLCDLFKTLGYSVVHNGGTGDQGADLIITKGGVKYVVQAKFYSSPIGNKAVQEVYSAISYYDADKGIVVTNNTFTDSAITLADKNNIKLIDKTKLDGLINKARSLDNDYLDDM